MDSYVDDKYDEQICDVCEEERDAEECVYYCAECDFIAEFNCVIFEEVHSLKEERGDILLKSVKRENDENRDHKEVRKRLTLGDMFEDLSTEDANKFADDVNKFADIIRQFVESFQKMGVDGSEDDVVVGSEDHVPVLENVPRSYEAFVRFITRLVGNKLETHVEARLDLITRQGKDKVVNVGDYMINEELVPVLQKLFANYDHDITDNCALSHYFKTVCLSLFCDVVQGMCNTKTMEITDKLFLQWWFNLKFVQHSGFKIDFVLNHLQKAGHARFRTDIEINQKSHLYRTLEEMGKVEQTIDELSQKMSKQKAKLEKLKNKKQGIISSHGSDSSRSAAARFIEVMECRMKNVGAGLL